MTFSCPWCLRAPKDFLYTDGENLQAMGPMLSVTPSGYYASCGYGQCERCGGEYIGLNLTMFDRDMDDDIAEYLYLNMDTRIITEETLEADGLKWELTVHETPHGIMLEHHFGPFPKAYVERAGAIYPCPADDNVAFLRELAVSLWPELISRFRQTG